MPVIEDQGRRAVRALVRLRQEFVPDILGAAEDLGDKLPHLVRGGALGRLLRFALGGGDLLGHVHHGAGIEAEEVSDKGNHDSADAQPASGYAHPPSILNIAAGPLFTESHDRLPPYTGIAEWVRSVRFSVALKTTG